MSPRGARSMVNLQGQESHFSLEFLIMKEMFSKKHSKMFPVSEEDQLINIGGEKLT